MGVWTIARRAKTHVTGLFSFWNRLGRKSMAQTIERASTVQFNIYDDNATSALTAFPIGLAPFDCEVVSISAYQSADAGAVKGSFKVSKKTVGDAAVDLCAATAFVAAEAVTTATTAVSTITANDLITVTTTAPTNAIAVTIVLNVKCVKDSS